MRHRLGNGPKCNECFYYTEKVDHDGCRYDGWCTNKHQLTHGINGRKRDKPLERYAVMWNGCCKEWEDAEDRLTRYEVECHIPEEWRTPIEKEHIRRLLEVAKD